MALATSVAVGSAQASVVLDYSDFSSIAGLTFVGDTATSGTALRLVPAAVNQAGAAYSTTAISLGAGATFSTTFKFRMSNPGGIDPADGFTFVLSQNTTGLGNAGGGLGYEGVVNSVAIEFDIFNNGPQDNNSSNHIAVDINGVLGTIGYANPSGVATCDFGVGVGAGCMANGQEWTATIGYDGSLLNVSLQEGAGPIQNLIVNLPIDIASALGGTSAFVGFTGGTGSGTADHDILSWKLANTTELAPVPEPATLGILGLGLAALGWSRASRGRARQA